MNEIIFGKYLGWCLVFLVKGGYFVVVVFFFWVIFGLGFFDWVFFFVGVRLM